MLVEMLIDVAVDIVEWMILFSIRINELNVVVDVDGCEHSRWQWIHWFIELNVVVVEYNVVDIE